MSWEADIVALERRGASPELIAGIIEASEATAADLKVMLTWTDEELKAFEERLIGMTEDALDVTEDRLRKAAAAPYN